MVLVVAAISYLCFFSRLDALGLVGPDEPRYAAVAREMAESGDWVTPRLYGQPWFEKPVLYYWGAALAYRVFGVNEFATRLPSALGAALTTLALVWAAWRIYGILTARAVLLILPTCVAMFGFARTAGPDMLFSAWLTAAMLAARRAVRIPREQTPAGSGARAAALVAFGVFLGAATLAKGPAAIALAGGSAGLWALATRTWRDAFRLAHPLAILAFCVAALPWYALCAARNPDFARTFLFQHNVARYLTPVFRHEQPFWFYLPVLLLGLLPWTAMLTGLGRDAVEAWREKRWQGSVTFFFACWSIFPILFFSFSKSKLPGYVLPAVPPLGLLLARSVARLIREKGTGTQWLFSGIGITFVLIGGVGYAGTLLPAKVTLLLVKPFTLLPWIVLAILGGLGVAILGWLRKPAAALIVSALLTAGLIGGVSELLPQIDPRLSARKAARAAQVLPDAAENVSAYHLHRTWHYGLNFYLHRALPEWTPESAGPAWVYTSATGLAELRRQRIPFDVINDFSPQAILLRVPARSTNVGGGGPSEP